MPMLLFWFYWLLFLFLFFIFFTLLFLFVFFILFIFLSWLSNFNLFNALFLFWFWVFFFLFSNLLFSCFMSSFSGFDWRFFFTFSLTRRSFSTFGWDFDCESMSWSTCFSFSCIILIIESWSTITFLSTWIFFSFLSISSLYWISNSSLILRRYSLSRSSSPGSLTSVSSSSFSIDSRPGFLRIRSSWMLLIISSSSSESDSDSLSTSTSLIAFSSSLLYILVLSLKRKFYCCFRIRVRHYSCSLYFILHQNAQ